MNKRNFILLLEVLISVVAFAQGLTPKDMHRMNLDAVQVLDKYMEYSEFASEKPQNLVRLFLNEDVVIYSDLLGTGTDSVLTIKEYANRLSQLVAPSVTLYNVRKERVYHTVDGWKMSLIFDKEISYTNDCGVLFSAREFYGDVHHIRMVLGWTQSLDTCRIVSLDGCVSSQRSLPSKYVIIDSTSVRDRSLLADNAQVSFNSFHQALVPENAVLSYGDDVDMYVKPIVEDTLCLRYKVKYYPRRFRLKAYGLVGVSPYVVSADELEYSKSPYSGGFLDLGYIYLSKKKFQMGTFVGLGISGSSVDLELNHLSYQYDVHKGVDIDGDTYLRHYDLDGLKQRQKNVDICIPIYLDFNYQVHPIVSLYIDAGIRLHCLAITNCTPVEGSYTTWGVYPQYGDLVLDYSSGIPGFYNKLDFGSIKQEVVPLNMNKVTLGVLGNLGMRVRLAKSLYLDASAGYEYGVTPLYTNPNAKKMDIYDGYTTESNSFSTYLDGRECVSGLMQFMSECRLRMLNFNLGVIFKL